MRKPNQTLAQVSGHARSINALHWAPHSGNHICTSGEDGTTCIHSCEYAPTNDQQDQGSRTTKPRFVTNPILAYSTNVLSFSSSFYLILVFIPLSFEICMHQIPTFGINRILLKT